MRSHTGLRRAGAWLATTSLCLTSLAPAYAQQEPPPGVEQAGVEGTDPPALAGRLASTQGSVSFHASGETQWNAAALNYPVTTGEAFWTEPQAAATLEIADSRVVMDDSTELDINALDQAQFTASEAQGAVYVELSSLPSGQTVSFNTPRGVVQISAIGRYEIVAGDTNDATTVTVVEGAVHISGNNVSGNNVSLDVGPQQTATIGGTDQLVGSVGPMQEDPFLRAQLAAREQMTASSQQQSSSVVPQRVRYMTGGADLQRYGSYQQNAQYGQVWYPNDVARDWAPYRDGHWAYVQPWGWTWVDNARWGFAPFHYGRWVDVNDRWGWVPGGGEAVADESPYPVYSPAMVSFVDVAGAALAGAAVGFAAGELVGGYAPAWIPLGPREAYYPWYHTRGDYFARMNRPYGVPRDIIARGPTYINNVTINNRTNSFVNRRAATVIPAGAFARGEPVRGLGRPLPERALLAARPVVARMPVRPTAFTPNLPPAAARRFNVALPRNPVRPVAAGPRIQPLGEGRGMGRGPGQRMPELRRAALPGNVHAVPAGRVQVRPGQGTGPGPGGAAGLRSDRGHPGLTDQLNRPGAPGPQLPLNRAGGLPPLRTPGARPEAVPAGGAKTPPRNSGAGGGLRGERAGNGATPGATPGLRAEPPAAGQAPAKRADNPRNGVPGVQAPRQTPPSRLEATRPAPAPRVEAPREQAGRPQTPRTEAPRLATRPEAPRPAPVARPEAPRPRPVAPRPAPRVEAARPAPRVEAARPAPRMETPRPAPRVEAARPAPRMETPRPAPRIEAPRPMPRPAAPPPHPAAAAPHPGPERPHH